MVLGKHSGRAAFRARLEELGISFDTNEALNDTFQRFKDLADKKHEVFDEDLQALVSDARKAAEDERFKLVLLEVQFENRRNTGGAGGGEHGWSRSGSSR
jgi:2-isopropylmalate synthase